MFHWKLKVIELIELANQIPVDGQHSISTKKKTLFI